jgi:formate C-acetyltransferase
MTERVTRLRQATLQAKPRLSVERAALLTEFYRRDKTISTPIRRALIAQLLVLFQRLVDNFF